MKELYYEPNEDEYCIGFEYQTLSDQRFPEKDSSWSNVKINSLKDLEDICNYLIVDDFIEHRVKYLDKDDIESLGFKHKVTADNKNSFYKGEYDISLYTIENNKYNLYVSCNFGVLFYGFIKFSRHFISTK